MGGLLAGLWRKPPQQAGPDLACQWGPFSALDFESELTDKPCPGAGPLGFSTLGLLSP